MALAVKISCTFTGCSHEFDNLPEMKRHKKASLEHNYCHVCDIDFEEWEDWVNHMADRSGKDVLGKRKKDYEREKDTGVFWDNKQTYGPTYGELKHHKWYCRECGGCWGLKSSRDKHVLQEHKVSQNIHCIGCEDSFDRASALIRHLEEGGCPIISGQEFRGYLQHKGLVSKLLENPKLLEDIAGKDVYGYIESAADNTHDGGVSLLDLNNDNINWTAPIEPDKPSLDAKIRPEQQKWPALDADCGSELSVRLDALSVSEPSAKNASALDGHTGQWHGAVAKKLFGDARSTPATNEWLKRSEQMHSEGTKSNILTFQFWNPNSPHYDPNRFWDPIIEKHRCPFPACEKYFDIPADCQYHIQDDHAVTQIRCPCCLKLFGAHHALIAHVENSNKCKIKYSDKFGQALDALSGGFLSHKIMLHPGLETDEDGYGVGFVQYESAIPPGFIENQVDTTVIGHEI